MLYFFGPGPQNTLFEPVSSTVFKFDGQTINASAQDVTNFREVTSFVQEDVQVTHIYQNREIVFVDAQQNVTLSLFFRYCAIMHVQLTNTTTGETLSPLYCVQCDMVLVDMLNSLLQ